MNYLSIIFIGLPTGGAQQPMCLAKIKNEYNRPRYSSNLVLLFFLVRVLKSGIDEPNVIQNGIDSDEKNMIIVEN